jgi:hypothetical protein
LLGVIAHARVNHHPVQMVTQRLSNEPAPAQAAAEAPASQPAAAPQNTAWDPHEVWLNRVKKPRETRTA